jgi:hypothetical protein
MMETLFTLMFQLLHYQKDSTGLVGQRDNKQTIIRLLVGIIFMLLFNETKHAVVTFLVMFA